MLMDFLRLLDMGLALRVGHLVVGEGQRLGVPESGVTGEHLDLRDETTEWSKLHTEQLP